MKHVAAEFWKNSGDNRPKLGYVSLGHKDQTEHVRPTAVAAATAAAE